MIPVKLGHEPEILKQKRHEWGEEYAIAIATGIKPAERFRRDDVKDALRRETHEKCVYCESHIEHVSFSHIEHLIPKSIKPHLVCAWENLTIACEKCNKYKGSYHSETEPLLNPYRDNVFFAIDFYGPIAMDRCEKAKLTINKLQLNRPDLIFRRGERIKYIIKMLHLIEVTNSAAMREALLDELKENLSVKTEYTSCTLRFIVDEAPRRSITVPNLDQLRPEGSN